MLVQPDPKRKLATELQIMAAVINAFDVEANAESEAERPAAHPHDLAGACATRRIDGFDPGVSPGVVAIGIGQQAPDDIGRGSDGVSRADVQLSIYVPTPLNVNR